MRHHVEVIPLCSYRLGRWNRKGLQLGFAAVGNQEIRRGVRQLAIALESETRAIRHSPVDRRSR
jgi:hypothetical protein